MKGCKKKTAFIFDEDAKWIEDFFISSGQSDNFGMVVRNAVSDYVKRKKQARVAVYFKFIGEENFKILEDHANENGIDLDQLIKDILIQKSEYLAKMSGDKNGN